MVSSGYELKCSFCGVMFQGSPTQVSRFRLSGGTKKICCSPICVREHRSQNAKKMHEQGRLVWGSPAQIEQAYALGKSAPRGEKAYNWKGGKYSTAEKAAMRARGEVLRAARDKVRPTCARCKTEFVADRNQRHKFRHGKGFRFFCAECRVHPSYHLYRVNTAFNAADEARYYADAECAGCSTVFTPNAGQRNYRLHTRKSKLYCTDDCRKQHMPKGEDSPGWRHGLYSVAMKEVRALRYEIKKLINQGADK